jgi:lycopene cyclase domain-containing protein
VVSHLFYLALLGACLVVTVPLELLGARVWRQPRRLATTVVPVAVVFSLIDRLEVAQGLWRYNPRLVSGVRILGLPVEEVAFFVVIPICALLTYETVRRRRELLAKVRRWH